MDSHGLGAADCAAWGGDLPLLLHYWKVARTIAILSISWRFGREQGLKLAFNLGNCGSTFENELSFTHAPARSPSSHT
uniref:hypothetical protein n=1 Tax=uncultured Pseudomonas sp. TaxID=114707 RepID=UPI00258ECE14